MTVAREQLAGFEARLLERRRTLRADIARELGKYRDDRNGAFATEVADHAELSVACLVVDLDLAEIGRDIRELRDVEAALKRLESGTFGACVGCGAAIAPVQLERTPAAARCARCEQRAAPLRADRNTTGAIRAV
jgi:RNA polymerase-binding transcription factor DksA